MYRMIIDDHIDESQVDVVKDIPEAPTFHIMDNKLRLTVYFKLEKGFVPVNFRCETDKPYSFYLTEETRELLKEIINEDDLQTEYMSVRNSMNEVRNFRVTILHHHCIFNVIGLRLLQFLELRLANNTFTLRRLPLYL